MLGRTVVKEQEKYFNSEIEKKIFDSKAKIGQKSIHWIGALSIKITQHNTFPSNENMVVADFEMPNETTRLCFQHSEVSLGAIIST